MITEEFLDWYQNQPKEAGRFELWDGRIRRKRGGTGSANAERAGHARIQVISSWERPNHLTRSEHAVLVKTCDLAGAKAALAYKKRHPPPYKDKFEKSPLSKARFGAVDNCAKRHGLKVKRRYRYR